MDLITILKLSFEVLVFAAATYAFIRFLQETQGSAVLKGFVIIMLLVVVALPLVARIAKLEHLRYVAEHGLGIIVIALVVIFQPELRQALVRLGETRVLSGLGRTVGMRREVGEAIVQACERCARRGLGALIVVERDVGIAGFTAGGVQMGAVISAPLLVSIFFKDTPLHDGAVVVRGRRIVAAGCVLPLSASSSLSKALGTRHRAAIGATEENDAIAIVVSEETQRISVATGGELEIGVSTERLLEILVPEAKETDDMAAEGVPA